MSLSHELNNPNSPIMQFLSSICDMPAANRLINKWNHYLANQGRIYHIPDFSSHDFPLVGTAFDYLFRWRVLRDDFDASTLVAWQGALHINQSHVVSDIVMLGNQDPSMLPELSIVLSWYEQIFRSGIVSDYIGTLDEMLNNVPTSELEDVRLLDATIEDVWDLKAIRMGFVQNPILPNGGLVGGADGDWIAKGVLYDCKTSVKKHPMTINNLNQIICYALLDWHNQFNLTGLGLYYPRQKTKIEYPIERLISDIEDKRNAFKTVVIEQYKSIDVFDMLDMLLFDK